ncbi:pre-mRNA-splicing factor Rse1p [Trichomonascus vanleenenianus]|uniref:U2 snRNP complex subunit RSE1 n=1 Tax=Trichomonascus vanleenenianus TaxID=2268995 RepID=UPI003ECAD66C
MTRHLYALTVQKPTAIVQSVVGNFSGEKLQEIVVSRGSYIDLLRINPATGNVHTILSHNTFSIVRQIAPFKIAGTSKDRLVVATDSGKLSVLEYHAESNTFAQIHLEPYGKSGVRRIVPGQYLAVDPKGRAALVASVERNKLVYVLNRDAKANITISNPLEAHTPRNLVYAVTGVDVGYENPVFAALEVDYSDAEQGDATEKKLTYYELDLGLNHVIKRWSDAVDRDANYLVRVPGGHDGPSGVLVCSNGSICYRHVGRPSVRVPIPRRRDTKEDYPVYIVASDVHKARGEFFFLLQTSLSDVFKLTMALDAANRVVEAMTIQYFAALPPCITMNILRAGFLFAACESGNHQLYQFLKLEDERAATFSSTDDLKTGPTFTVFDTENIQLVHDMNSLDSLMGVDVSTVAIDETPQIHTISGRGSRSTFRTLQYGLPVEEYSSSALPAVPLGIWTVRQRSEDSSDKYIVLAFANRTLVLGVGENVEEVSDSGFDTSVQTIAVQQLGSNAILQVHQNGLRSISESGEINEWTPGQDDGYVVHASTNNAQVVLALSTNKLVYFEVDEDGELNEFNERPEVSGGIACLSVGDVPEGRLRSSLLAVGCANETIRIYSLDPGSTLEELVVQALTAAPSDVCIASMRSTAETPQALYLHIGLVSGVYISSVLDAVTAQLTDTRTRFLGLKEIKIVRTTIVAGGEEDEGSKSNRRDAVLVLCTKTWVGYSSATSTFDMTPIAYPQLQNAASFSSAVVPHGLIGLDGHRLRIFNLQSLDEKLRQSRVQLRLTPRRMARSALSRCYFVAEADYNTADDGSLDPYLAEVYGYGREAGKWSSCIEVVDSGAGEVTQRLTLEDNEAAFSVATVRFSSRDDQEYIVIGSAQNQQFLPRRTCSAAYISVYEYADDTLAKLRLVHKTKVSEVPLAMVAFQGRLLVGVGSKVRIYDIGMKQLLRKAELELGISTISALSVDGDRIAVGDMRHSCVYLVYKPLDNVLVPFADDPIQRHVTAMELLDRDTVIAGDRFGNLFMLSCSDSASQMAEEDEHAAYLRNLKPQYNGDAPTKLDLETHFYAQDVAVALTRAQLVSGGSEVVLYGGVQGTLGVLIPVIAKSDVTFFQTLERLMRQLDAPITGRHHIAFRGYYAPVKGTIDGDLCERFTHLAMPHQEKIAQELGRTVRDVERKISDMRIQSVF